MDEVDIMLTSATDPSKNDDLPVSPDEDDAK
jgi:hypothetical protein